MITPTKGPFPPFSGYEPSVQNFIIRFTHTSAEDSFLFPLFDSSCFLLTLFFFFDDDEQIQTKGKDYLGGSFPLLILMENKMEEKLRMLPNTRLVAAHLMK